MSNVRSVRRYLFHCLAAAGVLVPTTVFAQVVQEQAFFTNLFNQCAANAVAASPNPTLTTTCLNAFPAGAFAGGTYGTSAGAANVGSTGSYASAGQAGLQRQREIDDEEAKKRRRLGGGSGDFTAGPFGGFVTVQKSHTVRALSDLENGYDANLKGILVGLDRRFGNDLVTGVSFGRTNVDSNYLNGAGTLSAHNASLMLYTTYLPTSSTYLGAYLGGGRGDQDATRRIVVGSIAGTAFSSGKSSQMLGGVSAGYNWYGSGGLSVALSEAVDSVRNRVDAVSESGNTGLELAYPEQRTSSLTSTTGVRASYRTAFSWGAVTPSIRTSFVHEFKDNSRTISPTLVSVPSVVLPYTTDAPDRNYLISGAGATVEAGKGTQFFVDYEKRTGHRFIVTWAASVGVILEF